MSRTQSLVSRNSSILSTHSRNASIHKKSIAEALDGARDQQPRMVKASIRAHEPKISVHGTDSSADGGNSVPKTNPVLGISAAHQSSPEQEALIETHVNNRQNQQFKRKQTTAANCK